MYSLPVIIFVSCQIKSKASSFSTQVFHISHAWINQNYPNKFLKQTKSTTLSNESKLFVKVMLHGTTRNNNLSRVTWRAITTFSDFLLRQNVENFWTTNKILQQRDNFSRNVCCAEICCCELSRVTSPLCDQIKFKWTCTETRNTAK